MWKFPVPSSIGKNAAALIVHKIMGFNPGIIIKLCGACVTIQTKVILETKKKDHWQMLALFHIVSKYYTTYHKVPDIELVHS